MLNIFLVFWNFLVMVFGSVVDAFVWLFDFVVSLF